jgi:hypothetical protein
MDDIFMIVTPDPYDTSVSPSQWVPSRIKNPFKDLFKSYSQIYENHQVAASNKWYSEHTIEDYYKWLWGKCPEDYDEYQPEKQGGTLLFIIMMKKLQSRTNSSVQYLINSVKNLKISGFRERM